MWLVIGYWHLVISENIDIDLSVDRSNWENPLDPLSNYIKCNEDHVKQFVNCQYQLAKCSKSVCFFFKGFFDYELDIDFR